MTAATPDPFVASDAWEAAFAVGATTRTGTLATAGLPERVFRWASVTKLISSLAVLVAVEEQTVDLDQPAGPPGSTLRHLLCHASGLAFNDGTVLAPPGTRRIYSNRGIELAAAAVEASADIPFDDYLTESVLAPLGMGATRLQGSPAWGAFGPLEDLLALGRELLEPTLVSAPVMTEATGVVFPGLDGVLPGYGRQAPNDWGIGFEVRGHKHPHWTGDRNSPATFGHFGQSGSFLWVDPIHRLAAACLAATDFGPWAAQSWPVLSDAMLARWAPPANA